MLEECEGLHPATWSRRRRRSQGRRCPRQHLARIYMQAYRLPGDGLGRHGQECALARVRERQDLVGGRSALHRLPQLHLEY